MNAPVVVACLLAAVAIAGCGTTAPSTSPSSSPTADGGTIPCAEPSGGWPTVAPGIAAGSDQQAAVSYVQGQPDGVGAWFVHPGSASTDGGSATSGTPGEGVASGDLVLVAVFTGHLARHQSALHRLWSGGLCVTAATSSTSSPA